MAGVQLSCVQCRQPLPNGATFCSACGRPVDADGDGLPDALGAMIEARARAVVAEERRKQEEAEAARARTALLTKLTADTAAAELALQANAKLPRSWLGAFRHLAVLTTISFFIGWLLIGPLLHFVIGAIGVSPAGVVLCPSHCAGCDGPGRVFVWSYKGSWHSEHGRMGYALVCHNKLHDVEKLTWTDVRSDPINTELQPYMISGFTSFFVEGLVLSPTAGIAIALLFANKRRRRYDVERAELELQLRNLAAQRASLTDAPVAAVATFRG